MKKRIKIFTKINALIAFIAAILIAMLIGYKTVKSKIVFFLSNPIEAGGAVIIPQEFQSREFLKFSWKSIKVVLNGVDIFIESPKISIYPMLGNRRELLNVSMDSVYAGINPEMFGESSPSNLEHISHPDFVLPFRVSVNAKKAFADVKNVGAWSLDSLVAAKSGRQKRFYVRAQNISGSYLAKKLFLNAEYMWNELFSDAQLSISDRAADSVLVALNAPRLRLEDMSADVSASIDSLPAWLGDKWPKAAPSLGKISLRANAAANALNAKASYNLLLKTSMGEFWQLPFFNVSAKIAGSHAGISKCELSLKGDYEESVYFKGSMNWDLDGSGELEIKGINITLGPQTLPAGAKFSNISKSGKTVSASFATDAGSKFEAKINDIDNPVAIFSADIASDEPWAVQWTGDMVKLAGPTALNGSFSFKETLLKGNLKTSVPFAYYAAVDELDVSFWLDPDGIRFPKGSIMRKGKESEFDGEVMWLKEYFAFKLRQENQGFAEVYGTFSPRPDGMPAIKIDLGLQSLDTDLLPFADSSMLRGYSGIVSGTLAHDLSSRQGRASVSVSTVIQDLSVFAMSDARLSGDSLFVDKFEIEQSGKRLNGYLFALLPSEKRESFDAQRARVNIPNMNLVSLLATFNDSTLASGFANGGLEFDKEKGLHGEVLFSKIALNGLDSGAARFPNVRLKALGDSAKIFSSIFLAGDLWNGNLEAAISKPWQNKGFPVNLSYAADNIGNKGDLKFEGFISKDFKRIIGNLMLKGDWFLPGGIGEIKNANMSVFASTALGKNALDSLDASFSAEDNVFEKNVLKIPFALGGYVRNGMLRVDSLIAYGQNDEKINAKLQFDLSSAQLKDLSFKTDIFTLFLLDEHWIKIRNGMGRTKLEQDGITILAELPSITYRMESAEYGTAHASAQGQAQYRFPFQTDQSQTNASLTGSFDISNVTYKKNFSVTPDFWHLDKTFKAVSKFFASAFKEKNVSAAEKYALTGRPTTLNLKIRTTGADKASINTNFIEFPFAVNLSVLGTTRNMLISGDINAVDNGKIGYNSLTMFSLSSFRVYWQDLPLKHGEIELQASNSYPFCDPSKNQNEECMVSLNLSGTFERLNMQPSASCNINASPALIYYSMLLGCISEDYESGGSLIDRNKVAGKLLGSLVSSTANKGIGKNVVGSVDVNWAFFASGEEAQEQDTNYVRVPFNISRNLEAVLAYTQDNSMYKRYENSYEAGLRYNLPVFDDSADINRNFIDPSLSLSGNLIRRSYAEDAGSGQYEARLEQSVGLFYKHRFWDPCILGLGRCNASLKEKPSGKEN